MADPKGRHPQATKATVNLVDDDSNEEDEEVCATTTGSLGQMLSLVETTDVPSST